MSNPVRLKSWLLIVAGSGFTATLLPLLAAWRHLPEPMATHWGLGGAPNGALPRAGFALVLGGALALPAVFAWPRQRAVSGRGAPAAFASVVTSSLLVSMLSAYALWLNWNRSEWRLAGHLPLWHALVLLGVSLAVAAVAFVVARRVWPRGDSSASAPDAALSLAPGERAYWSGTASNHGLLLLGLAAFGQGWLLVSVLAKGPHSSRFALLIPVLVLIVLELFSKIRVTVNEQGVSIYYGHLGWLRQRLPLERVLAARSFELVPMEHGGWGYRGSLMLAKRAAVVVRSGVALRLDLDGGKHFAISVDDAETAARLINGFVSRRALPAPGTASPSVSTR
jgi:uncharacterized protein DUF1648